TPTGRGRGPGSGHFFFFFQAEDGIRDLIVTGVQTCALPISVADYFRGHLWPNTPDILHATLQQGGRPAFKLRLVLAATLSSLYGDRKSTRLNSSHDQISYAVFCLKKKTDQLSVPVGTSSARR